MPRFEVTGPDGHRYEVMAPEGAKESEVMERVRAEATKKPETPKEITPEDRRAYTEASNDLSRPENVKAQAALEEKYGGRDTFTMALDPVGEVAGRYVLPPALALATGYGAATLATPAGVIPAAAMNKAAYEPTMKAVADTAMRGASAVGQGAKAVWNDPRTQWLVRALEAGGAFELARRAMRGKE